MINLAVLLGLHITEKICGTSSESARVIAESRRMNRESRDLVLNISRSTDEIFEQIALGSRLLAEQMKNDNLRRLKEIERDRRKLINS